MRVLQRLGLVDSLVDTQGDAAANKATAAAAAAAAGLSAVPGQGVGVGSGSMAGRGSGPPAGEELKSITLANPDGSAIVTFPTRWVGVRGRVGAGQGGQWGVCGCVWMEGLELLHLGIHGCHAHAQPTGSAARTLC